MPTVRTSSAEEVTRSEHSKEKLEKLARLNRKRLSTPLSPTEQRDLEQLRAAMPSSPKQQPPPTRTIRRSLCRADAGLSARARAANADRIPNVAPGRSRPRCRNGERTERLSDGGRFRGDLPEQVESREAPVRPLQTDRRIRFSGSFGRDLAHMCSGAPPVRLLRGLGRRRDRAHQAEGPLSRGGHSSGRTTCSLADNATEARVPIRSDRQRPACWMSPRRRGHPILRPPTGPTGAHRPP